MFRICRKGSTQTVERVNLTAKPKQPGRSARCRCGVRDHILRMASLAVRTARAKELTSMDKAKARKAVIELFRKTPNGVSFVEIERALEDAGINPKGSYALVNDRLNVALWVNVTEEFIELYKELVTEGIIRARPANPMIYFIDGKVPSLPIAKRIPNNGYKELHWMPMELEQGDNFPKQ